MSDEVICASADPSTMKVMADHWLASPTHPDRPPPPISTGEVRTLAYYDNDLRMTLLAGTVRPLQGRWQKDMQGDIWEDWTSSDRLQVLHQTQEDLCQGPAIVGTAHVR